MKERHKLLAAVYVVLIDDRNRVLLSRRFQTGYRDGLYGLPSGHVERGESFVQAAIREASEEIGVHFRPEELAHVHTLYRKAEIGEYVDVFFRADSWPEGPRNMEPEKCDDLQWFPLDVLPESTIPYISDMLQEIRYGRIYSEREDDV